MFRQTRSPSGRMSISNLSTLLICLPMPSTFLTVRHSASGLVHSVGNVFCILSLIVLLFNGHCLVTGKQVYQPTQAEIDRFHLIQQQIESQRQHEARSPALQVAAMARHPFLSQLLLNHLTSEQVHQESSPRVSPLVQPQQHPMAPTALAVAREHLPVLPQFPQVALVHQQLAERQSQPMQHDPTSSLHNAPSVNPDTYRLLMHKNLPLPGEMPVEMEAKLHATDSEPQIENKDLDFADSDRDDRHHMEDSHGRRSLFGPRRCYACSWSIAQCSDFNCYNNPDICTNNHFKPHKVPTADCPTACEQYVVTDPNGLITTWKRGCAPPTLPIKGTRCNSHYELGIRIDRCICSHDWCNWASTKHRVSLVLLLLALGLNFVLVRLRF